jgi:inner membrane protein
MASAFSHAVAALSIGTCFYRPEIPKRIWLAGVVCSVIPDLDVIGFRFGIRYGDFWGHRGFTHSLVFAALLSVAATAILFRSDKLGIRRPAVFAYLFLATASHGALDAMTNGGLGVAFSLPSTIAVISCRGDPFVFRQSASLGSSLREVSPSSKMNFCGFGFRRFCSRGWC